MKLLKWLLLAPRFHTVPILAVPNLLSSGIWDPSFGGYVSLLAQKKQEKEKSMKDAFNFWEDTQKLLPSAYHYGNTSPQYERKKDYPNFSAFSCA